MLNDQRLLLMSTFYFYFPGKTKTIIQHSELLKQQKAKKKLLRLKKKNEKKGKQEKEVYTHTHAWDPLGAGPCFPPHPHPRTHLPLHSRLCNLCQKTVCKDLPWAAHNYNGYIRI